MSLSFNEIFKTILTADKVASRKAARGVRKLLYGSHSGSNDYADIKNIIGIYSYDDLIIAAAQEDRSLGNYIKHRLKVHMENGKKNPAS